MLRPRQFQPTSVWRAVAITSCAVLVAAAILIHALAAYLADVNPSWALLLNPAQPKALLSLADQELAAILDAHARDAGPDGAEGEPGDRTADFARLSTGSSGRATGEGVPAAQNPPADGVPSKTSQAALQRIRDRAERVLAQEPFNARALRILGQLAALEGDRARADRLMRLAATRSRRESVAVDWMMRDAYARRAFDEAVSYADALLRTRPNIASDVVPVLAALAETPGASQPLKIMLAQNPPWRARFFSLLPTSVRDERTPLDLLLSLKDAPYPAARQDINGYLTWLIGRKSYELAYYTWLQFLTPEELGAVGFLINGSFERPPSGYPFDWTVAKGSGVTIDIVPRTDEADQNALLIEFGQGRVDFKGVSQILMLAPGRYRLSGRAKGEIAGRRGLQWRLTCLAEKGVPLGESEMALGLLPTWKTFEVELFVPETDCRAQMLRLELAARSASEQFVSGSLWYDEIKISPQ